jgi:hypothetical protein
LFTAEGVDVSFDPGLVPTGANQAVNATVLGLNLLYVLAGLVQLDFGQHYPSNVLLNPTLIDSVITEDVPGTDTSSAVWEALTGDFPNPNPPINLTADAVHDGIDFSQPGSVAVEYTCHFYEPKTPAQIVVATAVATLTLFNSGWGVTMLAIAFLAKRKREKGAGTTFDPASRDWLTWRFR